MIRRTLRRTLGRTLGRTLRRTLCLLLPLAALVAAPLFGRDWSQCPGVVTLQTTQVVYALGDTHGDYDRMVALLAAGKLIDGVPASPAQVKWAGGNAILVVTGDLIDKWKHSLDVIACLRALIASAAAQGGQVIISAGNHEAEFLADPQGSKTQEFAGELTAAGIQPADVANGTDSAGIGQFLLCRPFGTRVNDWFFSHAGSAKGRTFTQLGTDIQSGVDADGYNTKVLLGKQGLLEARMNPPWWQRDGDKPLDSMARLLGYADALGVQHIVFGHQPGTYTFNDGSTRKKGTLFQNFDGLVFLIDTGMSRGVNYSQGALLRIDGTGAQQKATAVFPDGTEKQVWP